MSDGEGFAVFHLPSDLFWGDDVLQAAVSSTCLDHRIGSKPPTALGTFLRLTHIVSQQCNGASPWKCAPQKLSGNTEGAYDCGTVEDHPEPSTLLLYQHSQQSRGSPKQSFSVHKGHDGQTTVVRPWQSYHSGKSVRGWTGPGHLKSTGNTFRLNAGLMAISRHASKQAYHESSKTPSTCCPASSISADDLPTQHPDQLSRRNDLTPPCYAPACIIFRDAEMALSRRNFSPGQPPREFTRQWYQVASSATIDTEGEAETKCSDDLQLMDVTSDEGYERSTAVYTRKGRTASRRTDSHALETSSINLLSDILSAALTGGVTAEGRGNKRVYARHLGHNGTHGMTDGIDVLPIKVPQQKQNMDADAKRNRSPISLPLEYQLFLEDTQDLIANVQRGGLLPALFPSSMDNNEPDICSLTSRRVVIHEEDWGTRRLNDEMLACDTDSLSADLPRYLQPNVVDEKNSSSLHNLLSSQAGRSLREDKASIGESVNPWAVFLNAASQEHLREGLRPLSSIEWSAAVAITVHLYAKKIQSTPQRQPHAETEDNRTGKEKFFSDSRCDAFHWNTIDNGQSPCSARAAEQFSAPSPITLSELTR